MEKVRERLLRATGALEQAGIAYAVIGGNAVASWVSGVDEAAVRNTQDVDILLSRADLDQAATALALAGFIKLPVDGSDLFADPGAKPRDAVRLVFAGEKTRPDNLLSAPDVAESEPFSRYQVLGLFALVKMGLSSFRIKDRVNLRDLLEVGLIDASWKQRFPTELAARLQELLDTPDG